MKKAFLYTLCVLSLTAILYGCGDTLDIQQDYGFTVEYLPVPKKLTRGETAEIRLQIVKEGDWTDAAYRLRYFQPDGRGTLADESGTVFLPNDLYDLPDEVFRLYYTSHSEDTQKIDLYFVDNFSKTFTLSFSFNNENADEE